MPVLQTVLKCATGLLATVGPADPDTAVMQENGPSMNVAAAFVPINKRSIDAVSWGCERLDVFGTSPNTQIYHKFWDADDDSGHATWSSLGGGSLTPPTAVSTQHSHVDVFHVSIDKAVYVKHLHNTTWSDWVSLGGGVVSNVAATSWGPAHIDIFALGGADGNTPYGKTMDRGLWASSWEDLGGKIKSDLSAVSWGYGRIDVFGIGLNDAMYIRSYEGGKWLGSGWSSLGGSFSSPPTAVSRGKGKLDVFAVDKAGVPQHKSFSGGAWSDWSSLGGVVYSVLSAKVSSFFGTTRIDVFALGGGDQIFQQTFNEATGKWQGWSPHGTSLDVAPVVAGGRYTDRLDILALDKTASAMWHQAWNGTSWELSQTTWDDEKGRFKKFS